jgi:hypothetical protein
MNGIKFEFSETLDQVDLEMLFIIVFVLVDDLYREIVPDCVLNRPGPDPRLSDSEVITISLVGEMLFDSETSWLDFVYRNYRYLFPNLNERSRFHRRNKDLWVVKNLLRHRILGNLNTPFERYHLVDSMPVPICKYVRAKRCRFFLGEVDKGMMFGVCESKDEKIYGFKLHLLITVEGIIVNFIIAPAAPHDLTLLSEVLEAFNNIVVGGDKGYISKALQETLKQAQKIILITPKRVNQIEKNTEAEKWFLARYRKMVETVNSLLSEQFHITRTRARKLWGLFSKIISKITSLTLCSYINKLMGRPLLEVKSLAF